MQSRAALLISLLLGAAAFLSSELQPASGLNHLLTWLGSGGKVHRESRIVYPFSLVPGGTLTPAELRSRPDRYARQFYGDLDYRTAVLWSSNGASHYNSYRVGNRIYQKTKRSRTLVGEPLIMLHRRSGEIVFIRSRCGNLLLDTVDHPTQPEADQPTDAQLGDSPDEPPPPPATSQPTPPILIDPVAVASSPTLNGTFYSLPDSDGTVAASGFGSAAGGAPLLTKPHADLPVTDGPALILPTPEPSQFWCLTFLALFFGGVLESQRNRRR